VAGGRGWKTEAKKGKTSRKNDTRETYSKKAEKDEEQGYLGGERT